MTFEVVKHADGRPAMSRRTRFAAPHRTSKRLTGKRRSLQALAVMTLTVLCLGGITGNAQESQPTTSEESTRPTTLRFAFSGTPWREVLHWLAEEANLALHVGNLPAGSFTYADPDEFTVSEAISRVNLFLIPQGYTVVKRGSLLSVISLTDPRSLQQLDALAMPTPISDLAGRDEHEIVKCMIPLGGLLAEDAIAELRPLMLMNAPIVLPKSNQLILTETVGKVQSALAVLQALNVPQDDMVVRRFDLRHVDVATVMNVAGTHIGLPPGATEGIEISLSGDISGKSLFAMGSAERIVRLEGLIAVLDVPGETSDSTAPMTLRSYPVTGDNLQAIYDVLQTVLAGKSLRLSMQPGTKTIVALADDTVHQQIAHTITEMQAPAIDFALIELNSVDPYFALTLVEEMFETPLPSKDSKEVQPAAPKVDADPGNRQLFVRGTTDQIEQIKKMISDLDAPKSRSDSARLLPLRGQFGVEILEAAGRSWDGDNRLLVHPSSNAIGDKHGPIERVLHPEDVTDQPVSAPSPSPSRLEQRDQTGASYRKAKWPSDALVSVNLDEQDKDHSPIRSRLVPEGILIESDDLDALDRFQNQIMELASSASRAPVPAVIYYLKYVNAGDAVKMLADLLDGGRSLADTPGNTLINGDAYSYYSGDYYGSFTEKKEGGITVTAGTATIVSDARLNRLIVQGTAADVAEIDEYMKIIDKGTSLTTVETFGRSHVIELAHTRATDVAELVKEAFANRIATKAQPSAQPGNAQGNPSGDQRKPSNSSDRGDGVNGQRDDQREVTEKPTRGRLPEMTVAAHEASNSLIITGPTSLFEEVEALVRSIDTMSEQVVEVIPARDGVDLEAIMRRLNGETVEVRASKTSSSSTSSSSSNKSSKTTSKPSKSSSR